TLDLRRVLGRYELRLGGLDLGVELRRVRLLRRDERDVAEKPDQEPADCKARGDQLLLREAAGHGVVEPPCTEPVIWNWTRFLPLPVPVAVPAPAVPLPALGPLVAVTSLMAVKFGRRARRCRTSATERSEEVVPERVKPWLVPVSAAAPASVEVGACRLSAVSQTSSGSTRA